MKSKPLLVVIFLITYSFINAQELSIGVKGGVNYNSIGAFFSHGSSIGSGVPDESFLADNEIGTQYGIFFSVNYPNFFIRPEVNFVSLKNSYNFPLKVSKWSAQQIDVPILLGYKIYNPVYLFAGPVFSFISDINMEGWQDTSYVDPFVYNKSSTSICAGILLDFGIVGIDFRYQYSLTTVEAQKLDMIKNTYGVNLGDLVNYNPNQFMISVQIKPFTIGGGERSKRRTGSIWRDHRNL